MKRFCMITLGLFITLSVCDLGFTYLLVEGSGGSVYEANPVAAGWLTDYGWVGLAVFKTAAVCVVVASVALIVRYRPALGAAVACTACLATGAVNLHSHRLLSETESGSSAEEHYPVLFTVEN